MKHLNRLGNTVHHDTEVLEDQWRDGRTRFRSRYGTIGPKPCKWW